MTTVTTVPPETPRPAAGEVAARPPHRPAPVGPMLRALFLKEARELAPWLALAALAFSAATALAFRTVATHAVNRTADAMGGLLAGVFMLVYLLVPAGTALLAGFALSGLLHEMAISLPVRAGFGLPLALHASGRSRAGRARSVQRRPPAHGLAGTHLGFRLAHGAAAAPVPPAVPFGRALAHARS